MGIRSKRFKLETGHTGKIKKKSPKGDQKVLRSEQEPFQVFVDANIAGVVIADSAGNVTLANDYYLRLIGYSREELEQGLVDWRAITPAEWLPLDEQAIQELRRIGKCKPYEKEYLRRDGTRVSVYLVDALLPGPGEQIAAFVLDMTDRKLAEAKIKDINAELEARVQRRTAELVAANQALEKEISERNQIETDLKETESRYRDLVENSQDLICVHDLQGRILSSNPAGARMAGYERMEIIGMNIRDLLTPEAKPAFTGYIETLEKDGKANGLMHIQTRSGERRIWEYSNSLRREGVDVPVIRGIARDVTDREHAISQLGESEERYRAIFNGVHEAIFVISHDGKILTANRQACDMYGYKARDFLAISVSELFPESEKNYIIEQGKSAVTDLPVDTLNRRADGELFPVAISGSKQTINGQEVNLLVVRDITERKRASLRQEVLHQALRAVSNKLNVDQAAQAAVDIIAKLTNYPHICIVLPDESGANWVVRGAAGRLAAELGEKYSMERGVIGRAFKSGELQRVEDIQKDPAYVREVRSEDTLELRSEIVAPIRRGDHVLGALNVESERVDAFNQDDVVMIQSLADIIALSFENANSYERAQQEIVERKAIEQEILKQIERLKALAEIDQVITSSFDLNFTLKFVLQNIIKQLGIDAACILLLNPHFPVLEFTVGDGFRTPALQLTRLPVGQGYAGRAVLERRTIEVSGVDKRKTDFLRSPHFAREGFVHYFGVPMIAKGQVKGVLEIFHRSPLNPDPDWLSYLETLSTQTAIAIDNSTLFEGLQRSNIDLAQAYDATIEGWSRALDLRDKETEGHTQRVTEMTVRLAREMGLNQEEIMHLRRGALLHDIGKMGVPDTILLKPDKLSEEEWDIMRQHPQVAYDLLAGIAYLKPALDIPYCHHEKWDGTGYPRSLKGEQIPLAARIFAIADVWDALCSDRPYRKAWSKTDSLNYIREQSGKHFEPGVVRAFLSLKEK